MESPEKKAPSIQPDAVIEALATVAATVKAARLAVGLTIVEAAQRTRGSRWGEVKKSAWGRVETGESVADVGSGCGGGFGRTERAIRQKQDRFAGTTVTSLTWMLLEQSDKPFNGSYLILNLLKTSGESAFLGSIDFQHGGPDWKYLKCNGLRFLIDGKPLDAGAVRHEGKTSTSDVVGLQLAETVYFAPTREVLEAIAQAGKVEGQLCLSEFELDQAERTSIRQFLDVVDGKAAPPNL
jgi:hypothetical protein